MLDEDRKEHGAPERILRSPGDRSGGGFDASAKVGLSKQAFERLARLRYQLRVFLRFSEEASRAAGLTPQQHQLLLALKGFPGRDFATPAELAERLQIRHNACVGLVTRAEQLGLVTRRANDDDHRSVWVHLTPAGEQVLLALSQLHLEELRRMGLWMSDGEEGG